MINGNKEEINQIIKKLLNSVSATDKPPIILTSKDLDMIIDYTYYTLKMNINLQKLRNNHYQNHIITQPLKKSSISTPTELTQKTLIEVKPPNGDININDNDLDNYIKQAEKYILTINRKTIDSLEKEQQLNINELLSQLPSTNKKDNIIDETKLLLNIEKNKILM